jgi:guanylate kinase
MEGKLLIFCAPSGAGKSTIVRHLMALDLNLAFSISATSRSPRQGEVSGKDYYFITPGQFREKIAAGAFVEWEEVYPNQFYGTLHSEIERIWEAGQHAVFDIDVKGGLSLKEQFAGRALSVFIRPPSMKILEERLRGRGTDTEESLVKRLGKAEYEMSYASHFDAEIVNQDLHVCLEEAEDLVREFLSSPQKVAPNP